MNPKKSKWEGKKILKRKKEKKIAENNFIKGHFGTATGLNTPI